MVEQGQDKTVHPDLLAPSFGNLRLGDRMPKPPPHCSSLFAADGRCSCSRGSRPPVPGFFWGSSGFSASVTTERPPNDVPNRGQPEIPHTARIRHGHQLSHPPDNIFTISIFCALPLTLAQRSPQSPRTSSLDPEIFFCAAECRFRRPSARYASQPRAGKRPLL